METVQATYIYFEKHKARFLEELKEFLRIPSVSTSTQHVADIRAAAEFVRAKLEHAGMDECVILETKGHPVVFAQKIIDEKKPTVLVYGHYDVQPPDPIELWQSPPFEPDVRNGNVYARGAADDKGQMYMHIKALEALLAAHELSCNVKCLFEGEEEIGSLHLPAFVKDHKELLSCDVALISDTHIVANEIPSITVGLRGLAYIEMTIIGPSRDLHSGMYGGAVANPCNVLADIIAQMKDDQNRVAIPGFYDDVIEVSPQEREGYKEIPFDEKAYCEDVCVDALACESGYSAWEATTIRPTLDVNGMWGGFTQEGSKTVLPSKASAKISMRLVPNQSSEKIIELFTRFVHNIAPSSVKIDIVVHAGGNACVVGTDSHAYLSASVAMERTFGKKPIAVRCGGSIPIVKLFQEELGVDSILMGFGLESDNIHSPNEKFGVWNFYKGIETIPWFYEEFAKRH